MIEPDRHFAVHTRIRDYLQGLHRYLPDRERYASLASPDLSSISLLSLAEVLLASPVARKIIFIPPDFNGVREIPNNMIALRVIRSIGKPIIHAALRLEQLHDPENPKRWATTELLTHWLYQTRTDQTILGRISVYQRYDSRGPNQAMQTSGTKLCADLCPMRPDFLHDWPQGLCFNRRAIRRRLMGTPVPIPDFSINDHVNELLEAVEQFVDEPVITLEAMLSLKQEVVKDGYDILYPDSSRESELHRQPQYVTPTYPGSEIAQSAL